MKLARLFTVLALLLTIVSVGCGTAAETKVVTSANSFAFYQARYHEACADVVGPVTCDAEKAALDRWRARLDEAQAALERSKNGGKLPLQLAELKRIEKETKKCRPR